MYEEENEEADINCYLNIEPSDKIVLNRHRIAELDEKMIHNFGNDRLIKRYQKMKEKLIHTIERTQEDKHIEELYSMVETNNSILTTLPILSDISNSSTSPMDDNNYISSDMKEFISNDQIEDSGF